jgi:hypothetical protein
MWDQKARTRILKHLNKYNILSIEQYGFMIGLKTDNTIYKVMRFKCYEQ